MVKKKIKIEKDRNEGMDSKSKKAGIKPRCSIGLQLCCKTRRGNNRVNNEMPWTVNQQLIDFYHIKIAGFRSSITLEINKIFSI